MSPWSRTPAVAERADYTADTDGSRDFPWRVLAIARRDGELIENDIVHRPGRPDPQMECADDQEGPA